jgi:hypothetical protein
LKRNGANSAPAEEDLLTAITAAQQQKRKALNCAALALVKLYHSTNRAADAHAVLSSGLAGFLPTP